MQMLSLPEADERVRRAVLQRQLTEPAGQNIAKWLHDAAYAEYLPALLEHISAGKWQTLDDVFWTVIPFGTGGRRGKMYPIGSNAINDRTIGESVQGLVDYLRQVHPDRSQLSCAIAYDTRHRSREFAELSAEILAAAGIKVEFLDGVRSTPELSFCVRHKQCDAGVMVTASHNPPSDNAVKVYWSTGGQLLPPHDKGVIEKVLQVSQIHRLPFAQAKSQGLVQFCQAEVDAAFLANVVAQSLQPSRDVKVLYSSLHGVGHTAVLPALKQAGFTDVTHYGPHAEPNGDFPNVPGHVSNPENPGVFDSIIQAAQQSQADVILATDPDCDRLGVAAPVGKDRTGPWKTFTGNQIGALLVDYVLDRRRKAGTLSPEHYVVKTLVTTEMISRIATAYGVKTVGDLHVGFKWIAGAIDRHGPEKYVFGAEESHGYQVGSYTRDKDAAVACLLMAELAASLKAQGQTLVQKLESLFWQFGCHQEQTISVTLPGSEGMAQMKAVMQRLRSGPPQKLGGMPVTRVLDYQRGVAIAGGTETPLTADRGDMVTLELTPGNYVAVRPSGTEPKIKFYLFTYEPAEQIGLMDVTVAELNTRLVGMEQDLRAYALS